MTGASEVAVRLITFTSPASALRRCPARVSEAVLGNSPGCEWRSNESVVSSRSRVGGGGEKAPPAQPTRRRLIFARTGERKQSRPRIEAGRPAHASILLREGDRASRAFLILLGSCDGERGPCEERPGRGQRGHDEGPGGVVDDAGEHGADDLAEAEGGRHHRESASWIPRGDPAGPGEAEGGDPHEGGSEERGGEENAGRANP